jgi:hypothetical protein
MFGFNVNVAKALRPGLLVRYAQAQPRDSESRSFTEGWRTQAVSGEAGLAASRLPVDRLALIELFDGDEGYERGEWQRRLGDRLGDRIRVVERHGRHTDALRLSSQRRRGREIGRVVRQIRAGASVEELDHPVA